MTTDRSMMIIKLKEAFSKESQEKLLGRLVNQINYLTNENLYKLYVEKFEPDSIVKAEQFEFKF
jgi:hypothetical protein